MSDPRPEQLIADRFRFDRGRRFQTDHPRQMEAIRLFLSRVETGAYKFVHSPCPCGQPAEDVVVAEVDRYQLPLTNVVCMGCGTVRIDPYLDPTSLGDFYRTLYQDMYARADDPVEYFDRQRTYGKKVAAAFPRKANAEKVLEVGCGAGGGLSVLQEAGWKVAGCDYSARLIEYGRERGVPNLHTGGLADVVADLRPTRFDLIFLHHVFEHVDDPLDHLSLLAGLLAPGGQILIIVPALTGIHDHPFPAGDALQFFHVAHKYNYSPAGLQRAAARVGLSASVVRPPRRMGTVWSRAPELWMRLRSAKADNTPSPNAGGAVLKYLRRTEYLYRRRVAPAQLALRLRRFPIIGRLGRKLLLAAE
jgi:SAM-dependent methyltransferase